MFDVGFSEFTMIAIIALVVVGPKRLPGLAKTAGFWVGRARKTLSDVKRDIDREMDQAELGSLRDMKESLNTAKSDIDNAASDMTRSVNDEVSSVERAVNSSSTKSGEA